MGKRVVWIGGTEVRDVPAADVRRAAMFAGDLCAVARAAASGGSATLGAW